MAFASEPSQSRNSGARKQPRQPGQRPAPQSSSGPGDRAEPEPVVARRSPPRSDRTAPAASGVRRRRSRSGTRRPCARRRRQDRRCSARSSARSPRPPGTAAPCRHSGTRRRGCLSFSNTVTCVAVRDQRGIGEAGRAGADHGDALAARRLGLGEHRLAAGGAVDHAADARAAAHLVDAGVAGEAAPDRLPARELLDPLRIGDQACGRAR